MRSLLALGVLGLLATLLATVSRGAAAAPASLQAQIDRAQPGDTIVIEGGTYEERITIDKPVTLEGQDWPVIDGGGEGDVVTITGDDVTLSHFVIRNSGRAVSQEPAAVKVDGAHATTIEYNRIESSHFGIHMTHSHHPIISNNEIDVGNGVPQERRGHAIYLWEVEGGAIHANDITNAADGIHLEFADDNGIGENVVTNSRYAIHFMTANNNRVLNNVFTDNLSGALLMFSDDLLIKGNEFSNNRDGATGAGMLIKDVDNIFAEDNVLQRNKYGISIEGSPNTIGATATFIHNTLALNDTGIGLFSNAPITFIENAMIENIVQVEALSGALGLSSAHQTTPPTTSNSPGETDHPGHEGSASAPVAAAADAQATGPTWALGGRGNYWSDYNGYDANGDGVGDQAYRPEPAFAGALADNPTLRLFQFTLAQQALDMAADMFPVYQYDPVIEDDAPLMTAPGPALNDAQGTNGGMLLVSILLLTLAAALVQFILDFDPLEALFRQGKRAVGYFTGGAS